MKTLKHIILGLVLLLSYTTIAQQGLNYKAILKDDLGNVIANDNVRIQFTILDALSSGNIESQEIHTIMTDDNGIIIANIGKGAQSLSYGFFNDIDWGSHAHYLQVGIDITGGTNFEDMGTTEFNAVPYAKHAQIAETATNVSGLEQITEGSYTGWRLIDSEPENYGNIGSNAVDLSRSTSSSTTRGATEENSTAMGRNTTASGNTSTAMGFNTTAHGSNSISMGDNTTASGNSSTAMGGFTNASSTYSTAIGSNTIASGVVSIAMGENTTASGEVSTAIGENTTASGEISTAMGENTTASGEVSTTMGSFTIALGNISTAMGDSTIASGYISTALGQYTEAESYVETTIGCYNTDYIPDNTTDWDSDDRLFVIGNGQSNSNRSNAMTVLKNGNIGVGRDTPSSLLEVAHTSGSPLSQSLSILNTDTNNSWQFHTTSYLNLYRNGSFRGSWNATSGAYVQASDRRVKKDITSIENGTLNKVMQLNPVSYLMKDQTDTKRNLGLISQEVQKIFPSITNYNKEADILTLSYTELIPVLIKATQEQQEIIEALKLRIEVLENK